MDRVLRNAGLGAVGALLLMAPNAVASGPVAFTGHLVEASAEAVDLPGCIGVRNNLAGSGTTSLGPATAVGHSCITVDPLQGPMRVKDGLIAMTVPGGTVYVSYGASGPLPGLDLVFRLTGTFTFQGGTGAYAHVTGGGTVRAQAGVTSDSVVDLTGSITY